MHTNPNIEKVVRTRNTGRGTSRKRRVIKSGWDTIVVYDPSNLSPREMRGNRLLLAALKVWEAKQSRGIV